MINFVITTELAELFHWFPQPGFTIYMVWTAKKCVTLLELVVRRKTT
jgi:hypothetical protein